MRTTLEIDDDVLQAAKELAAKERTTAGAVISALARKGLLARDPEDSAKTRVHHGIVMLPRRGERITLDHVNKLRDTEGIW